MFDPLQIIRKWMVLMENNNGLIQWKMWLVYIIIIIVVIVYIFYGLVSNNIILKQNKYIMIVWNIICLKSIWILRKYRIKKIHGIYAHVIYLFNGQYY